MLSVVAAISLAVSPPNPPNPPNVPPGVTTRIHCDIGGYTYGVSWTLTCVMMGSLYTSVSGGCPYWEYAYIPFNSVCTLQMSNSVSDGWDNNMWMALGMEPMTLQTGWSSSTATFQVEANGIAQWVTGQSGIVRLPPPSPPSPPGWGSGTPPPPSPRPPPWYDGKEVNPDKNSWLNFVFLPIFFALCMVPVCLAVKCRCSNPMRMNLLQNVQNNGINTQVHVQMGPRNGAGLPPSPGGGVGSSGLCLCGMGAASTPGCGACSYGGSTCAGATGPVVVDGVLMGSAVPISGPQPVVVEAVAVDAVPAGTAAHGHGGGGSAYYSTSV